MAYVYIHINATTNAPFYVGIGSDDNGLFLRSKTNKGRSTQWSNIANKYGFIPQILYNNISWETACVLEKGLIEKYGRMDKGVGCLCNLTDGGDGAFGVKRSNEYREKARSKMLGNIPWNKGIKTGKGGFTGERSQSNRDSISNTLKSKNIRPIPYVRTDLHKKKTSETIKLVGVFTVNNPNKSSNWVSEVLTVTGIVTIIDFKSYCEANNINYINLTYWSRKNKQLDVLHPKYALKLIRIKKNEAQL